MVIAALSYGKLKFKNVSQSHNNIENSATILFLGYVLFDNSFTFGGQKLLNRSKERTETFITSPWKIFTRLSNFC